MLKVACIQCNSTAVMAENITCLQGMVAESVANGAQLVALPENAFLMEASGTARTLYRQEAHPAAQAARALAKEQNCWLLAGSIAVAVDDSGKTVNRSLLFDPQGKQVTSYDKIHLFDVTLPNGETYAESARFLPGERAVVAELPWGKLGMSICYDVRFPHLYRALAKAGAQLLAVPSAFTVPTGEAHWEVLLRARAIENGCFVVAPAQCGEHAGGRKTYGHALIIDPWGKVLAEAGSEPGIIMAEIDLEQVAQVRGRIPSLTHDRAFVKQAALCRRSDN